MKRCGRHAACRPAISDFVKWIHLPPRPYGLLKKQPHEGINDHAINDHDWPHNMNQPDSHLGTALTICRRVLMVVLLAGLLTWVAAAPLVWILRDGLGPDMVESGGVRSVLKFLVQWSVPAAVFAVPLLGLWLLERRFARSATRGAINSA